MASAHAPAAPCDSISVRIERATQIPTQNSPHSLLAGGRRTPHRKIGDPSKEQAAEGLASSCGLMRSRAKRAVTPRVGSFRFVVFKGDIRFSPKGGVKSGVLVWRHGLAGRGKWLDPMVVWSTPPEPMAKVAITPTPTDPTAPRTHPLDRGSSSWAYPGAAGLSCRGFPATFDGRFWFVQPRPC